MRNVIQHNVSACPLCDGIVTVVDAVTLRNRSTQIAACNGCEFIVDLRRADGVPKTSKQLLLEVATWLT